MGDPLQKRCSSTSDDWQTKRNLLLTVVKYVKCLDDDGDMELSLVMTKGNKWRAISFAEAEFFISR